MRQGQDEEFERFVGAEWATMFRLAHALTGDRSDAEDVVQTAFARTYTSWHRVQSADHPVAYVRRIVVNEARGSWRKRWRHVERPSATLPEIAERGHADHIAEADVIWRCLQRLPARQRAVIVLRYFEDLSEHEIARVLKIPPGTVKSRAASAMRALRDLIGDRNHRAGAATFPDDDGAERSHA